MGASSTTSVKDAKSGESEKRARSDSSAAEPAIKFKSGDAAEETKNAIVDIYMKHRSAATLPKLVEVMKKELDSKFSKGWIVFAGKHVVGVCSFIKNTMVEFEVDGTAYIVFQTYYPS